MPDGRRRSREHWADTMEAGPPDPPAHVHRLPGAVRVAIVGLTGAVFLLAIALGLVSVYVYQANQYVQGRGEFRDREADRLERSITDGICDLLEQLPAGALLDEVRRKYDCGPGLPPEAFPPEVQRELNGEPPTPAPLLPDGVESLPEDFALPGGAVQQEPREPYFPTPGMTEPEPTIPPPPGFPPPDPVQPTTPPPLVDLEPLTDLLEPLIRL